MNPITALTDQFEKLITEHGSATIQSKHISLLKDQFMILEKENAKLTSLYEKTESKNQMLKTENANLKSEIVQLKKKIQSYEKPSHNAAHTKEQEKILTFLAKHNDDMFPLEAITSACDLSEHKALYHLEKLEENSMIDVTYHDGVPYWSLDSDGRAYLIENNLVT